MKRSLYYDRQGKPITAERWGELTIQGVGADGHFGATSYKRVGEDCIEGVLVSTVWMGLDHSFTSWGEPVIFETMVFGGDFDQDCWRYSSEETAIAGHAAVVANVVAGREPFDGLSGEW